MGNDNAYIPQFGSFDTGRGGVLLGNGSGSFKVLPEEESGLLILENIKKILPAESKEPNQSLLAITANGKVITLKVNNFL